ncbi:tetratricopeptide repeat protein [Roseibacillus ishigakijimensis]|uniref:Tetratricopeptide repeat protein n=1 Tax=Roseibacillus ishigakijimensis TaxID=454146 RepID=A0A934RPB1_9BACT|nr:tetratricopeptide repeat protein [Roseibacillus ishigakijimensis]MBK1834490.1 tetratricopeptide repeat protein [Roseibacillus ishigakijimensis]
MKKFRTLLAVGLCAPLAMAQPTANDYFRQGEAALKAGNLELAKSSYKSALVLEPNHGNAKYRLLSMDRLSQEVSVNVRQKKLSAVILPQVTFEDLTLTESIEALAALVEKETGSDTAPNFVIDDPGKTISDNPVSIRLRNVPATTALQYVLSQGKAKARWDKHAITIRPLSTGSTGATSEGAE